jgi:hypothetical protein
MTCHRGLLADVARRSSGTSASLKLYFRTDGIKAKCLVRRTSCGGYLIMIRPSGLRLLKYSTATCFRQRSLTNRFKSVSAKSVRAAPEFYKNHHLRFSRNKAHPYSIHRSTVISALFNQGGDLRRKDLAYDSLDATTDPFEEVTCENLRRLFQQRGAIELSSPLLLPASDLYEDGYRKPVRLLDAEGTLVQLPFDLNVPFVRQVARDPGLSRLKRWTIGPVYRDQAGLVCPARPSD